jgi:hypothetical protein
MFDVWFLMSLLRKKLACFCCFIFCRLFAWPSKILDSHLGLYSTLICHFSTVFGGATPCAVPRAPPKMLSLDVARGSHQDPSTIYGSFVCSGRRWKQGGYSAKSDMCPPVNQLHQRCRSFRNGKPWISIACCMFTGW